MSTNKHCQLNIWLKKIQGLKWIFESLIYTIVQKFAVSQLKNNDNKLVLLFSKDKSKDIYNFTKDFCFNLLIIYPQKCLAAQLFLTLIIKNVWE